jgi:serpin B
VPFDSYRTQRSSFHRLDGGGAETEFMTTCNIDFMDVACLDGFGPEAPLQARRRSMDAVLHVRLPPGRARRPLDHGGRGHRVAGVSVRHLGGDEGEACHHPAAKFEISFSWTDLKRDLGRLGLSLLFSREAADLRGMCKGDDVAGGERRPTFLSKVAHRAVVKVNEAGTEAAATMGALRGGGGPPPEIVEFTADHPFTFFIMEQLSGVIMFAGHVLDPTK